MEKETNMNKKIEKVVEKTLRANKQDLLYKMNYITKLLSKNGWLPKKLSIECYNPLSWQYFNSKTEDGVYTTHLEIQSPQPWRIGKLYAVGIYLFTGEEYKELITTFFDLSELTYKIEKEKVIEKYIENQSDFAKDNEINLVFYKKN